MKIHSLQAPAILIRDAYLEYEKMILFDHLNLTLAPGKLTCLLGPSGVGKTTLLRIMAGLIGIDLKNNIVFHGQIECDNSRPLQNQIAYLAQQDLLLPWFNTLENALLGARLRGELNSSLSEQAHYLFDQMGLSTVKNKYPHQLSGGMRQRVALIRTLLEDKPIVLMDEPFSALDAITRFHLQTLTAELLKNRTVLLVTHDPLEALRLADEIYVLAGQPAVLKQVMHLNSAAPRELESPELVQHQAALFHALTHAKEITP